jgi:hypothetical protein
MANRTWVLAGNRVVEVEASTDRATNARASRAAILAVAAMRSQGQVISDYGAYAQRVYQRACTEDPQKVTGTLAKWARNVQGRFDWLPAVCDALLLQRERQSDGSYVQIGEVDPRVTTAAQNAFGHSFGDLCSDGGFTSCPICRLADNGDWESALRRAEPVDLHYDITCAAMTDGFKAARAGGLIPKIEIEPRSYKLGHKRRPLRDGEPAF